MNNTENAASQNSDDSGKIYDFKDSKTSGVVVVTKNWEDSLSNEERPVPDVSISTVKPRKSTLGYVITYHGNGLTFEDGSTENEIIVNSSGKIVSGKYKELSISPGWYSDSNCTTKIELDSDGIPVNGVSSDLDIYAKAVTFVLKTGYDFKSLIPSTATSVVFTDEAMPASAVLIDVDADEDGGVVAWMDDTTMKVSTQINGLKVQANTDSRYMFDNKSNLKNIDLTMLDTQKVTDMGRMFYGCKGLTDLDLSLLNTSKLQNAAGMFSKCSSLTSLDLSMLDFQNVSQISDVENNGYSYGAMFQDCYALKTLNLPHMTNKITNFSYLFKDCKNLTDLDLSSMDSSNVTNMSYMFCNCSGLTVLDLTPLDTRNVTNMRSMFSGCSGLTALDLSPLDTSNVTSMSSMFSGCRKLTSLDLTPLDTRNVTDMRNMFFDCSGLTTLDLAPLDTQNVTNMGSMFYNCSGLKTLDLTPLDTSNVTDMSSMFYTCRGLTALDLSSSDTSKVANMSWMFYGCSKLINLSLGDKFAFVGSGYALPSGTWYASDGTAYTSTTIPNNKADTYTRR